MLVDFDLEKVLKELSCINSKKDLNEFYDTRLGKKGKINDIFKNIKNLSDEDKKSFGQEVSSIRDKINSNYEDKIFQISTCDINKSLQEDIVDYSIDIGFDLGHYTILSKVRREIEEICKSLGFLVEYGYEVTTKFENFESVNIPLTHPATEMHDTIYLNDKDNFGENLILRTHTSSMQNFLIQKHGVPIKAVVPSRVYRYENMDATHDTMFYQMEGIYIDKDISIAHFKDSITKLLSAILKKDVEIRMRPGYFPFVEPGFEIDARYKIYNKDTEKEEISKWIEIIGAGMIHPNVLITAGLDPKIRSGFAFGIGISRVAAIRYGLKDIRYMTNGDLRFVKSF